MEAAAGVHGLLRVAAEIVGLQKEANREEEERALVERLGWFGGIDTRRHSPTANTQRIDVDFLSLVCGLHDRHIRSTVRLLFLLFLVDFFLLLFLFFMVLLLIIVHNFADGSRKCCGGAGRRCR